MTESMPSDDRTQGEHAAKFAQVTRNLKKLADALVTEHPEFPQVDFARCFLVAALAMLTGSIGDAATVEYLHTLVAELEATQSRVN